MPLNISTFSNQSGGNAFYKAVTHPLAAEKARHLVVHLQKAGPVAIYDPGNHLAGFAEFFRWVKSRLPGFMCRTSIRSAACSVIMPRSR